MGMNSEMQEISNLVQKAHRDWLKQPKGSMSVAIHEFYNMAAFNIYWSRHCATCGKDNTKERPDDDEFCQCE